MAKFQAAYDNHQNGLSKLDKCTIEDGINIMYIGTKPLQSHGMKKIIWQDLDLWLIIHQRYFLKSFACRHSCNLTAGAKWWGGQISLPRAESQPNKVNGHSLYWLISFIHQPEGNFCLWNTKSQSCTRCLIRLRRAYIWIDIGLHRKWGNFPFKTSGKIGKSP